MSPIESSGEEAESVPKSRQISRRSKFNKSDVNVSNKLLPGVAAVAIQPHGSSHRSSQAVLSNSSRNIIAAQSLLDNQLMKINNE